MLDWIAFFFVLTVAIEPWVLAVAVPFGLLLWWHLRSVPQRPEKPPAPQAYTAEGRFPLLNEDWVGETVLSIDDPEILRRHGARFRNPARYVIDLGNGDYLLYGGDGELWDLCHLK